MIIVSVIGMDKFFVCKDLVEVKESLVYGCGLFVCVLIFCDIVLGVLKIKVVKGDGFYVLWFDDEGKECYWVLCDLCFINYVKKFNVVYYDDLIVVVLKNIKVG